ncbi:sporulation membrane protein YtrI [Aquisalibacillus elongatus]|uniref:Sporulation membrane protein YtrI C-terminal domain-containing protein n=1 Tax=Aquisalibacillus elongatus TaxID=485577 RepID=A0A3N5BD13_9BACI|nr:sporulation membrane protein YtrI [Aquisalibacillus elongatus]RPF55363.1 hypothetical protein EDC24_0234 [Aquisalibacillus elongatus]
MMHIPPYYKKPKWQAFFLGVLAGGIIGYIVFLYMFGEHTERWIEENLTLRQDLRQLENDYELIKEETDDLNKQNEQRLNIRDVEIEFVNIEQMRLDRFTSLRLTALVEDEISTVIGRNIESVGEQHELLIRTIENKNFRVNDINYQVKVTLLVIGPTLDISLEIKVQTS